MKRLARWFCMVAGCAALCVYLFTTPGCACGDIFPQRVYHFLALNPIRDRAPEAVAQTFLRDQGQGKCLPAGSNLCRYALGSHAVLNWQLWAREDTRSTVALYYRVKAQEGSDTFWGQAEVDVHREAGRWTVAGYDAVY